MYIYLYTHMGGCQNYGPFLGPYYDTGPNLRDPKKDHNVDNPPYMYIYMDELLPPGETIEFSHDGLQHLSCQSGHVHITACSISRRPGVGFRV